PTAFAKAQAAAGSKLPDSGTAFITVADRDKAAATGIATILHDLGFRIIATRGTAQGIRKMGIPAEAINKIGEGSPHVVDWSERVTAPFGRRAATVTARERHGAYTVLRCTDRGGPRPQAGQFYMLSSATRWGGGEAERPFLPRAFSVLRAGPEAARGGLELQFLVEDVGPGTKRLCEL